jgi:penicillin-binding protein 2
VVTGDLRTRTRIAVIGVVVVSMFSALFVRLWYLQVMAPRAFAVAAQRNGVRLVHVDPPRGRILDRKDRVLVDNRVANVVTIDRSIAMLDLPPLLDRLAPILGVPAAELRKRFDDPRFTPYKPVPIAQDVPEAAVVAIKEQQDAFPKVRAVEQPVREYPLGTLGAHVLGYVGEINASELAANKSAGYRLGDRIGKSGVEAAFERDLRGRPGIEKFEVDSRGRVLRRLGGEDPLDGHDVHLTIDIDVQRAAEEALQQGIAAARASYDKEAKKNFLAPGGSVVVLDSRDGSVVAMASFPNFNPNDFLNGIRTDTYAALTNPTSGFPLENRTIQAQYAPGSTFKLATSLAALDQGLISPGFTYDDTGSVQVGNRVFRNARGRVYGRVNLARALAVSSDSFFYALGYRFWRLPGAAADHIQQVARSLGFGEPTRVGLPGELKGRVPDANWKRQIHDLKPKLFPDAHWFPGDNVNLAVGQGDVLATPLQLATAYAALQNGGTPYTPKLKATDPPAPRTAVAAVAAHRAAIVDGLRAAVADKSGTAAEAFAGFPLDRFPVYGKTGTAQANGKQDTSLFAGLMTGADGVPYTVVAVVEEAGFGSAIAAPIARRILQALAGVEPTPIVPVEGVD